jgi:TPR repeat protein
MISFPLNLIPGVQEAYETSFWLLMSNPFTIVPVCQFFLGLAYDGLNGHYLACEKTNILRNTQAAIALLKAGKNSHVHAQYIMGLNYDLGGPAVKQDYEKALIWYTKSHEQGNPGATFRVGLFPIMDMINC